MPVAILLSSTEDPGQLVTSRVRRFYTEERPEALPNTPLGCHAIRLHGHRIAKIASELEASIYEKLSVCSDTLGSLAVSTSNHILYYQEACRYWAKACKGLPFFKRNGKKMAPPHGRTIPFTSKKAATFAACILNSTLFYWFYSVFSDCEHINDKLVRDLPIPSRWPEGEWTKLYTQLSKSLSEHSTRKTISTRQGHEIEYDEMKAVYSKIDIDEIDRALARLYGFTDEELDFLVGYDSKYRGDVDDEED